MPRHPRVDNTPKPWGTHYSAVTTSSTDKGRTFVDGFAFIEGDGSEGLSWQHIEDVSAYDEYDLEMYTTRAGEHGYCEPFSGSGSGSANAYEAESVKQRGFRGFSWESEKKDSSSSSGGAEERGFKKVFGFGVDCGVKKRESGYMRELFRSVEVRGAKGGSDGEAKEGDSKKGSFGAGAKGNGKGPAGKK